MKTPSIPLGERFGRLVVQGFERRGRKIYWQCQCDCGVDRAIYAGNIKRGRSRSCGVCTRSEAARKITKHGFSKDGKIVPEYAIYMGIISRCYNTNRSIYQRYGGRGITVCDRWRFGEEGLPGAACFLADMGRRPSPQHSIERVGNDGNYEPTNCRWATPQEQSRNRRSSRLVTIDGKTMTFAEALTKCPVGENSVYGRIERGWSIEAALTQPDSRSLPYSARPPRTPDGK